MDDDFEERVRREREHYNEGLKLETYRSVLSHVDYYYRLDRFEIIGRELEFANGKRVLEIGTMTWKDYLEDRGIVPAETHAINISEKELIKGMERVSPDTKGKPIFCVMDGHQLAYGDDTFDLVFGASILHHLVHKTVLDEIQRVLKPEGIMFFLEPLDTNPVAKVIRFFTPQARTVDEQPWRFKELRELEERFACRYHYQTMMGVPFGLLSRAFFKNPDNWLNRSGFVMDRWIDKNLPFLRVFFRHLMVAGTPKKAMASKDITRKAA